MTCRSSVLALCLLTFDLLGCARAPVVLSPPHLDRLQQLTQDIAAATSSPGVQRAAWGIVVHSLDRDERIFDLNPRTLLVPASTAKLVSLATAVDAVGWNFRFETAVRATAPLVNGTLYGDLLIVGSGDPSIGGRAGQGIVCLGRRPSEHLVYVVSTGGSSATTTLLRSRAHSSHGHGTTSGTRPVCCLER